MNVQYAKVFAVGIAVGLLGGFVCVGITLFSYLCCFANLIGYLGPAASGIVAAVLGAGLQSTHDTIPGKEVPQGVVAGSASSLIAALTCSVIFGLMQLVYPVFMGIYSAMDSGTDVGTVVGVVFVTGLWAAMIALGVGVASSLMGLFGGALVGAIVGAIKSATRA